MSGEELRTLSVRHLMQKPALACEGSSGPCGMLLLGPGPVMDVVLNIPCVCTAHSAQSFLSTSSGCSNMEQNELAWANLCEQCTHVDKGEG